MSDSTQQLSIEQALQLAVQHHQRGDLITAESVYRQILGQVPGNADAWHLLGLVLHARGETADALAHVRRALEISPQAIFYANCGVMQGALGEVERAAEAYLAALAINPALPDAWNNLGNAYRSLGKIKEAEQAFRNALHHAPDMAVAQNNLAALLQETVDLNEAFVLAQQAVANQPDQPEAWASLGSIWRNKGQPEEAARCFQQAIALRPNEPQFHIGLGIAKLLMQEWTAGWQEYGWRVQGLTVPGATRWRGEVLAGRRLALLVDGGFGDMIQLARWLPKLSEQGALVVQAPVVLHALLQPLAPTAEWFSPDQPVPSCDFWAPWGDILPRLAPTPTHWAESKSTYLAAEASAAARWRFRLNAIPGLKVGLCWAGNPALSADARRSIPLEQFALFRGLDGVVFFSLQFGERGLQQQLAPTGLRIVDWTDQCADFSATAALVQGLDLVISVDTAVLHLAGGLGRPVWLANRFESEWRWGGHGEHGIWYDQLRIWQQPQAGDWTSVLADMRRELIAELQRHPGLQDTE